MAGPTNDPRDVDICAPVSQRYAVVARAYDRVGDLHVPRVADVDSVGVRAVVWGRDMDVFHIHILGVVDVEMEHLAVQGGYALDIGFCHIMNP